MASFVEYIKEELSFSQVRPFMKYFNKERYDKFFGGKYRIYIPFTEKQNDKEIVSETQELIDYYLTTLGYKLIDYKKGLARSNKSNRILKIGRILSKRYLLLKKFNSDATRQGAKLEDMLVVISRHPYDIAGMSTNRGWTSCMSLETGMYASDLYDDIKHGTLVAYLIKADDKNINKPISRIAIKPFYGKGKNVVLVPTKKQYGTNVDGFYDIVLEWCNEFNKSSKPGDYKIHSSLYNDSPYSEVELDKSYNIKERRRE